MIFLSQLANRIYPVKAVCLSMCVCVCVCVNHGGTNHDSCMYETL